MPWPARIGSAAKRRIPEVGSFHSGLLSSDPQGLEKISVAVVSSSMALHLNHFDRNDYPTLPDRGPCY